MSENETQYWTRLKEATSEILTSTAENKLIVAGPGTGKTTFFENAIKHYGGGRTDYLVLTFINNLVRDLKTSLGDSARVYTFHGYCLYLLKQYPDLSKNLRENFEYFPPIVRLLKNDWSIAYNQEAPDFYRLMRTLTIGDETRFFLVRSNYYQAVGYDDSVFRVYYSLEQGYSFPETFRLVIVDEYQDFNYLETRVLAQFIKNNNSLVVGDDDQALYTQLRSSDPKYIRELESSVNFEKFSLPYCLRSTKAVIDTFNKLVQRARENNLLTARINKPFFDFPPIKESDLRKYPHVRHAECSIQKNSENVNYGGRFIFEEMNRIPIDEIEESREKNFPTVLIIGPNHYLKTIASYFDVKQLNYSMTSKADSMSLTREDGLRLLSQSDKSNLGWRILMDCDHPEGYEDIIRRSLTHGESLLKGLPAVYIDGVLSEVALYSIEENVQVDEQVLLDKHEMDIRLTTYEGSKGLSAQHVFILGLQEGDLPRKNNNISDLEVCKLLVALTRARKQCIMLTFRHFLGHKKDKSVFVDWLYGDLEYCYVDKKYWEERT